MNVVPERANFVPMARDPITIAVFADVNANLIDGSTIWLQSICLCALRIPGARVVAVLRDHLHTDVVLGPVIAGGADIRVVADLCGYDKDHTGAGPEDLDRALQRLDAEVGVDLFLIRGESHLLTLANNADLRDRVWGYWLKRPLLVAPWQDEDLLEVAGAIGRIIVQSEQIRSVMETVYQIPSDKILTMPPMVPPEAWAVGDSRQDGLSLVYSGKLDKTYNVEAYLNLPSFLRFYGVDVAVTFIGDKFNAVKGDGGFVERMRGALERSPGVTWRQGLPRAEAMQLMAQATLGLCWRDEVYDSSLELSTKLLEFCALGVPPLLNRTDSHSALLGDDYPYFVKGADDIARALRRVIADPMEYNAIKARLRAVVSRFSFEEAAQRLQLEITKAGVRRRQRTAREDRRRRVLIASHDNKFLSAVLDRLKSDQTILIRHDRWASAQKHDRYASERHLQWADVIFCEWCAGAAVWYSNNRKAHQRCIVRLHRFEAFEDHPRRVNFTNVDRLIVVSDYFRDICATQFAVDPATIDVLPQYVDWSQLHRPKHPWAEFTLGLVGINGFFHKRFDRALDILVALRARDKRWRLRVRSVMPWNIDWVWNRPAEVKSFKEQFERIVTDQDLEDNIIFDPPGPDMAEWYRHVGFILSTSDSEGCHTSVAEGMASGAVPVIFDWPGSTSVYPSEFVSGSTEGMAEQLRRYENSDILTAERGRVSQIAKSFDIEVTLRRFEQLFSV